MGSFTVAVAGRGFQASVNDGRAVIDGEAPGVGTDLGTFFNVEVAVHDQRTPVEFDGGAVGVKTTDGHAGDRGLSAVKDFEGGSRRGVRFKTGGVVTGVRGEGTAADPDGAGEELLVLRIHSDGAAPLDEVACVTAYITVKGEGCFVADFDSGFHVAVAHHPVIDPIFAA